jgi:class 3 adenylate cyclase
LLLHCPPLVVLQTPKVMAVLSGEFAVRKRDDSTRNAGFFRQVVTHIPDAIVTVDIGTLNVVEVNIAGDRLFGLDVGSVNVVEFMNSPKWSGPIASLLAVRSEDQAVTESVTYQRNDAIVVNLEVTVHGMQESLVYVFRDVTSVVRCNTLIASERAKSEQLLKSILPASLVPRVQAGEKNISFAVTSATIVFMDIVRFTTWCGSKTAEKVMMILNSLFKKFDKNVSIQSTMTRIKCIGDCYMAAGGVFCQVNQPTEHAKQVVTFGLECIHAVSVMNTEMDEHLEIRVGVNTGGRVVAGVIDGGAAKPTFEILGPAINMARQMAYYGVPMKVHISRSVYELIYGDQFVVKERGTLDVKGTAVITYLVSEKTVGQRGRNFE